MKYFKAIILFLIVFIMLTGILRTFVTSIDIYALCATVFFPLLYLFISLEVLFLHLIQAREVTDREYPVFFDSMRGALYLTSLREPKVFIYRGNQNKIFIKKYLGSWFIILDKDLLSRADADLARDLFLFSRDYIVREDRFNSKLLGLMTLFYFCLSKLSSLIPKLSFISKLAKSFLAFIFLLFNPVLNLCYKLFYYNIKIKANPGLRNISSSASQDSFSADFLEHLTSVDQSGSSLIIRHLESFSPIHHCEFVNEY